jgi:hypothetical protein
VLGRRVVDHELPREAKPALRRLPAETGRDRLVGDAGAGEHRLLRGAAAPAENAEAGGIVEIEPRGGRFDRIGRGQVGVIHARRPQVGLERAGGEDHLPARRDVDGRVRSKNFETLEALVQVHVRDAAVRAGV